MTDDSLEKRKFEEYSQTIEWLRTSRSERELRGMQMMTGAFTTLTYLNGGALIAIPAVVKLFETNVKQATDFVVVAAILFVVGLVFVLVAQLFVAFTLARRQEMEQYLELEQLTLMRPTVLGDLSFEQTGAAENLRHKADEKSRHSNSWRHWSLIFFWLSLLAFVVGCCFGARAVLA